MGEWEGFAPVTWLTQRGARAAFPRVFHPPLPTPPAETTAEAECAIQPACEAATGQRMAPRTDGNGDAAVTAAAAVCDDCPPLPEPSSPGGNALDPPRPTATLTAASSEGSPTSSAKRERQTDPELQAAAAAAAAADPHQAEVEQPGAKRQRWEVATLVEKRLREDAERIEAAENALAAMTARAEVAESFAARLSGERLSWVAEREQRHQQERQQLEQQVQQLQAEVRQLKDSTEEMAAAAAAMELKYQLPQALAPAAATPDPAKLQQQLSQALAAKESLERRLALAADQQVALSHKLAEAQRLKQQGAERQQAQQPGHQPEQCASCQGWAEALTVKCQELAAAESARDAALAAAKQAADIAVLGHEEAVQVREQADREAAELRQQLQQMESERAAAMAAVGLAAQMLAQEEAQTAEEEGGQAGQPRDVKPQVALQAVLQQLAAELQAAPAPAAEQQQQQQQPFGLLQQADLPQQQAQQASAAEPSLPQTHGLLQKQHAVRLQPVHILPPQAQQAQQAGQQQMDATAQLLMALQPPQRPQSQPAAEGQAAAGQPMHHQASQLELPLPQPASSLPPLPPLPLPLLRPPQQRALPA